jgi:hypothetical protein
MKLPKLKTRTKIVLTFLYALLVFSLLPPITAFFSTVFVIFVAFRIDPKILGVVAIVLLLSIPALQYFEQNDRAEEVAVYVYFLLVTIVVLQILNAKDESSGEWIGNRRSAQKKKIDPIVIPERITYTKGGVTYAKKMTIPQRGQVETPVVKEIKSKIIRDIEKEEYIPPHRLAEHQATPVDDDGIPLRLSLPERLKLLSEKKRAGLQAVKPTLEDLNKLKVESEKLKAQRESYREIRTRYPVSDTKAIQNDWD